MDRWKWRLILLIVIVAFLILFISSATEVAEAFDKPFTVKTEETHE